MQSLSFSPESHRPPQTQCRYITLDSISGLCKRHWISWWCAPVTVPKLRGYHPTTPTVSPLRVYD